jgi:hypothetical protein
MKLAPWLSVIPMVQNEWAFLALVALLAFLYLTRK